MSIYVKHTDGTWHGGGSTASLVVKKPSSNVWSDPATTMVYVKKAVLIRTVTNKALTSNVATLTTSVAHGFVVGNWVYVQIADEQFNGIVQVASTPLTTTFTYARVNANVGSTAATGTATQMAWVEVYPLLPGTPTALVLAMPYRNDRIELDFSWTAPIGGSAAVHHYDVLLSAPGFAVGGYTVTAPTATLTVNGTTIGTFGWASGSGPGRTITAQVTPVSADGVRGATVSTSMVIPNLPPPPAPTAVGGSVSYGDITWHYTQAGGNRFSYVQVNVVYSATQATASFTGGAGTVTGTTSPVSGSSVNGGTYLVQCTAYGPGGQSAVVPVFIAIPADPVLPSALFNGNLLTTQGGLIFGSATTNVDVYYETATAGVFVYNTTSSGLTIDIDASGFPRDNVTQYRIVVQPKGPTGSGRVRVGNWIRRMANPAVFRAQDSATWNFGQWQGNSGGQYVFQGYAATYGYYWGYGFYGNSINALLNPGYVGYQLYCTSISIFMGREGPSFGPYFADYAGLNYSIRVGFALHTAADRSGHNESAFGGIDQATLATCFYGYDDYHYADLPAYFGDWLINATNGWKGIGVFSPDNVLQPLPPAGTSNSMARLYGHTAIPGIPFWQIEISHTG